MAEWWETQIVDPIMAFGANLQRGFNTVAPYISPLYGGIAGLTGGISPSGQGKTFGEWAETISQEKSPIQVITKETQKAWEATLHWGYEAQQNISWIAGGTAGFLDTAGKFANALGGYNGLLGSIGAILPLLLIGLVLLKK